MTLFFLEFGSYDWDRFRKAVELVSIGFVEVTCQVGTDAGQQRPVAGGVAEALALLFCGQTGYVSVRPRQGEIKWILLFAPNAMDSTIPMWHAMLELRSNSHEQIFQMLKQASLQYVTVSRDEPFNLTGNDLLPGHFPWKSPALVDAVIADDKGSYIERFSDSRPDT